MTLTYEGKSMIYDLDDIGRDSVEDLESILCDLRYRSQVYDDPEIYVEIGRVTRQLEILNERSA